MGGYTLIHHGPAWDLPAACPECIKIMAYLELAVVPFSCHACYNRPDSEQLPTLEDDDDEAPDKPKAAFNDEPGGVIAWLRRYGGVNLDGSLNVAELAELQAYSSLVDSTLADALQFTLWMEADNYIDARDAYAFHLPLPLRMIQGWRQHKKAQAKFGSVKDKVETVKEQLYAQAETAYSALAVRLGNNYNFFEGRPTSLDALVYSHLIFVIKAQLPNNQLKAMVQKHPSLVAFSNEMWERLLQSHAQRGSIPPPPFSRTPIPPRARAEPKSKAKKTAKDLAFRRRAQYFIAVQALVAIAFIFFASVVEVEDASFEDDGDYAED